MCKCKECGVEKVRITERNGRAFLHTDAAGRRWNGRKCPDCRLADNRKWYHSNKNDPKPPKKARKVVVEEDTELLGPADVLYPPKKRPCRVCSVSTVNYYACNSCQVRVLGRSPDAYYGADLAANYGDLTPLGLGMAGHGKSAGFRG